MNERTNVEWVFIITISIILGNTFSFVTQKIYTIWELKKITEEATKILNQKNIESQKRIKNNIEQARIKNNKAIERNAIQNEKNRKKMAIKQQQKKTCNYWKQKTIEKNTNYNRSNRDLACSRF